ncbi:MAG: hypothetical protein QNL62_21030 [Gammaproteobacteria bacterium]|nr:hypothetical protein [Gammaproteobacteria bacterium]
MKAKVILVALFSLFMANAVLADSHKPARTESVVVKQQFEVISINHEERWAMLKDRSGFTKRFDISVNARNFDQLVVGDVVNISYAETIHIQAFGADAINAGEEADAIFARTPEGEKPGGAIAEAKTLVVTIAAIDLENSLVTLKDKQGNTKTFRPRLPSNLKKVKVGDKVAISFAKALAITVEKGKQ